MRTWILPIWRYVTVLTTLLICSVSAQDLKKVSANCDGVMDKISSMQSDFSLDNCNMNFQRDDTTPLILAISKNNYPAAKKILEGGGLANFPNRFGNDPMIFAMLFGSKYGPTYINLLVDHGWKPDSYANFDGPLARSGFLPKAFGTHLPWLAAAAFTRSDSIAMLYQHGARLNQNETKQYLDLFAQLRADELSLIVRAGAAVDARDNKGNTLLHYVVLGYLSGERDLKKVAALLELGAKRFQKNNSGENAVEWAVLSKDKSLIDCLQNMKCR